MDPRITVITLGVTDFDRSLEYYRDGIGFPVRDQYDDYVLFELDR